MADPVIISHWHLLQFTYILDWCTYVKVWRKLGVCAGSVVQATGTVEFEDGLWIGNHLTARNGLQRVRTIPGVQPGAVPTPGFLRGQTEFQSALVHVAAW